MKLLSGLIFLMTCAIGLAKFLDAWLSRAEKEQINNKVVAIYLALGSSDPKTVIQAPIQALSYCIGFIFGERPYSLVAFLRYSAVTSALFLCASAISAIQNGSPFSVNSLPWMSFDATGSILDAVDQPFRDPKTLTPELKAVSDNVQKAVEDALAKRTPEERVQFSQSVAKFREIVKTIELYNNSANRTLYSILFFPLIIEIAVGVNFTATVFARQSIADMAEAKSLVSLFSLGVGNFVVLLFWSIFGFTLLCAVAIPFAWIIIWGLVVCGHKVSWLLALALLIPSLTTALFLGPMWIKILAGSIIAPDLFALMVAALAFTLFPFRKAILWVSVQFLDRGTSYEKGFLTFAIPIIAAVLGLIMWITKLFTT